MGNSGSIIIVGAGIGGLTAGLCLQRAGFDVQIIERFDEVKEVGAGILLSPNASHVLYNRLELGDELDAVSAPMSFGSVRSWRGKILAKQDLVRDANIGPCRMIHRAKLQRVLYEALGPDRVHLSSAAAGFEINNNSVEAITEGGQRFPARALVGADGVRSVIGAQLASGVQNPLRYHGYTCWRGITTAFENPDFPQETLMEIQGRGRRAGMGYVNNDRVYWWATAGTPPGQTDDPKTIHDDMLTTFGEFPAFFRAMIEATPAQNLLRNDIYDRRPSTIWGDGPVTLLGDAAHPMAPNLGQGACSSIEDADMLVVCLEQNDDIETALRTYEGLRQPRTAKMQKLSKRFGDIGQWKNAIAVRAREFSTSNIPESMMKKQVEWLWDYDAQKVYESSVSS